ncbi:MAG: AI-2E family transporter [Deltaproteobacteria bacterium]
MREGADLAKADLVFGLGLLGATAVGIALVVLLRSVAIPVLLGAAAAYTLDPVVSRLERHGLSRTAGTVIVGLGLGALVLSFLAFVLPALAQELELVPAELKQLAREGLPPSLGLSGMAARLPGWLANPVGLFTDRTAKVADRILPALSGIGAVALASTGTAVRVVTGAIVAPLVAFYLLRDYHALLSGAQSLVPVRFRASMAEHLAEVDRVMAGFIRGQLTVGALLSLAYTVVLGISGVHLALLIGVVTGFGNIIPYLGLVLGITLSLLMALLHWEGIALLAKIALSFGGLSLLESTFLTPRLVGNRVGLPAAAVVVAILSFGALFGFAGILVAVPATALLKVAARSLLRAWRASAWYA